MLNYFRTFSLSLAIHPRTLTLTHIHTNAAKLIFHAELNSSHITFAVRICLFFFFFFEVFKYI